MSAYRGFALVAVLGSVFLVAGSASAADTPAAEKVIVVPQSIGRALEKVRKEKKLKIAYFGGSISNGAGVADSWRARTTAWFRKRAPEAKITEVDATADGGSEYGAFRIRKDLIEQDPDLVFIEFAVDDAGRDEQRTLRSFEGVVRHFWTVNPWAEIVVVHTTTKPLASGYEAGAGPKAGAVPKAVALHKSIAEHYGIPEIDLGRALVDEIKTGRNTWETLTADGVHPNDAGSAICFRAIEAFLEAHAGDKAAEPVVVLPAPLTKDPFHGAFVIKGSTLYAPGWTKVPKPPELKETAPLPPHLEGEAVGSELTHVFTGSAVGLFLLTGPDCGDVEWSVDGSPPKRLSAYDTQAGATGRIKCVILADDLASGKEHTLVIRILPEKAPQATGTKIRIAAVFMHCDC